MRALFGSAVAVLGMASFASEAVAQYVAETRTMDVDGVNRSYLLARPDPMPTTALPLVISLHGDGGNSASMRAALPLEAAATNAGQQAVFVYPKSAAGAFEYWSDAGRAHEGLFVQQLISALQGPLGIDANRVYLVGFSGGATMANALGCRLGRGVIRGLGIHSGSLYPAGGDFGYTPGGGVTCALPPAILVWGMTDATPGVDFATGQAIRNNYLATHGCAASTTPFAPAPCVNYDDCAHTVSWCAIPGLGHSVWGSGSTAEQSAATAIWWFIAADTPDVLFANGFESPTAAGERWVQGYYVGYERSLQSPSQIDFSGITHLMLGRLIPNADATLATHFDIDNVNGPIWAHAAVGAAHAADRKVILMVGGAGEINGWRAAATPANRPTFVANLLSVMDTFAADGLDLDWEPIDTQDHADLLALAQALRAARPHMLLTLPVTWVNTNMQWNPRPPGEVAFLHAIAPLLDRISVMSYEMAADYAGWHSWFASPLNGHGPNTPSSVSSSIDYYLDSGVPAAKLGVGFGFYGNCFRNVSQPRVPVAPGDFVISDGAMSYRNIVANYLPAMTGHFDATAQAPWLGSATQAGPQGCNLVTYEDAASVAAKAHYARDNQLGSAIIWTISQGHLPDAPVGQRDPLLTALRENYLE